MNTTHLTIITGSSRGLGAALVAQRLLPGHRVLGMARKVNTGLQARAEAHGSAVVLTQWPVDLTDAAPVAQRLHAWLDAQAHAGLVSVTLINNAGLLATPAPVDQVPAAELVAALRVGLEATVLMTSAFLAGTQHWPAQRRVLNISSGLGRRGMAGQAVYCAAKAGMDNFSSAVALEQALHANPARVVSIAPGVVDTDMQVHLRAGNPALFPDHERFVAFHKSGQLTSPEACARQLWVALESPDFGREVVTHIERG